jgi:hypothetical protein
MRLRALRHFVKRNSKWLGRKQCRLVSEISLPCLTAVAAAAAIVAAPASAQNKYDPGASDTEITEQQVRVRFLESITR